jgi:glutamate--cysteine ligase
MLPFVFEDGMGFERYVDYALGVPMYFVYRDGRYIDASGQSFPDFLDGRLPALPGERPTITDWNDHLTTLFPEVRLKRFLEMRGADGGPWRSLCALPALWVGLLYHQATLDAAWDLVRDWTIEELDALRAAVPRAGLKAPFRGRLLHDVAREVLELAADGLQARAEEDWSGQDERQFLTALRAVVESGRTPAEEKLDLFRGRWRGSVDPIFAEFAY